MDASVRYDLCVLKIDVEGYEDEALSSILEDRIPQMPDYILMEIDYEHLWKRDLMTELAAVGYKETSRTNGNVLLKLELGNPA